MRIGILTLPLHTNYGGILQAYALQAVLKRMGHEAILLDRGWLKRGFVRDLLSRIKWDCKSLISSKNLITPQLQEKMGLRIRGFIRNYINPRAEIRTISDIKRLNLEAIVVGSDQVWRKHYSPRNITFYYLDFAKQWNIKRLAYAASFGIEDWDYTPEQTLLCKELLEKFVAVSVREDSGKKLCKEYLNQEAEVLLDPTLLLEAGDYKKMILMDEEPIKGNLFCYVLDKNHKVQDIIGGVAEKLAYKPFYIDGGDSFSTVGIKPSVECWLKGFADAKFVVTDSFHGCVFSIIFNKPFLVYGNERRGKTRFVSLLSKFGLEDRLITSVDEIDMKVKKAIDWRYVNERLIMFRQESLIFLETNLSKNL